jgi:hypothetical protein
MTGDDYRVRVEHKAGSVLAERPTRLPLTFLRAIRRQGPHQTNSAECGMTAGHKPTPDIPKPMRA